MVLESETEGSVLTPKPVTVEVLRAATGNPINKGCGPVTARMVDGNGFYIGEAYRPD
jgi:hypothetical protein